MKEIAAALPAGVYFFFNVVALPPPITFTALLSLLKVKTVSENHFRSLAGLALILALYGTIHLTLGVRIADYFQSTGFFALLLFSGFAAYDYLKPRAGTMNQTFEWMSIGALGLLLVGLLTISSGLEKYFWFDHYFTTGGARVKRFSGLAYEPSHLAFTLCPLFLYFLVKTVNKPNWKTLSYLAALSLPIGLTLSFGFAAVLVASLIGTILVLAVTYAKFEKPFLIPVGIAMIGTVAICSFTNPFSERIAHILKGKDTSVNGRTTEAFMLAYRCAETRSVWFGIGLGQVKIVGEEVIRPYYAAMDPVGYRKENVPVMRLPNSMAETLAMFGILGVLLKLGVELFLFFSFKVYRNYFSLSVFCFIFVYQLMGSFVLSTTEVMMWVLAVTPLFPELDVQSQGAHHGIDAG